MFMTYIIGFSETNEFLDSKRVVWVFIWMHLEGELAVSFLNVSDGSIIIDAQDHEWIEGLQVLN